MKTTNIINIQDSLSTCQLLFVFGTLKQGYGNNRCLERAEYMGEAMSSSMDYAMTRGGGFPLMYVDCPDEGTRIKGEIYKMNEESFIRTDNLEGYPHFYNRRVDQFLLDGYGLVSAWIYFNGYKPDGGPFCSEWNYRREGSLCG